MPSPNGTPHQNVLYAVSATGPDDVWAVGYQIVDDARGQVALIEHWDGSTWSVVPAHAGSFITLYGVKAFAPDDVWAVGNRGFSTTLTEHWDGASWTVVPSPNPGGNVDLLNAIDGTSGTDVWAVGSSHRSGSTLFGLILHWAGSGWIRNRGRLGPDGFQTALFATTAISPGDVWAVGETSPSDQFVPFVPALAHWDGARWNKVPGPATDQSLRTFGVDAVSPDDVWAVGGVGRGRGGLSLLH